MARTVAADAAYKFAILLLIIYLSWGVGGEKRYAGAACECPYFARAKSDLAVGYGTRAWRM